MKKIVLSFVCVAVLAACKKDNATGPEGPQGPAGNNATAPAGNISGNIEQTDQYYATYTTGLNTTTVSLDGTSISTITDAAGNYTLTNVQAGIYDMSLMKSGCGLTKHQQISFPGNGTLYLNAGISDKASFTFSAGYVKDTLGQIKIHLNYAAVSSYRYGIIIFGKTNATDINNPQSYDQLSSFNLMSNSTSYSSMGPYSDLDQVKFPSGTIVYVKVYPNNYANSNYIDYVNNRHYYTGCGTPLPTTYTLTMP